MMYIKETYNIPTDILDILLIDRTKQYMKLPERNIIWATDNYESRGEDYGMMKPIYRQLITGKNEDVIKPRRCKSKIEQAKRTKEKAEVFTPSWVCNVQNNYPDEQRFGKDVFNKADYQNKSWNTISDPIPFPMKEGGDWKDYIRANVLEITCGEAPYLVSRYDTTTGEYISIKDRIGQLDRKIRVLNENYKEYARINHSKSQKEWWLYYAKEAVKHTYGYEWQGDNLLLARKNVLFDIIDYYIDQFNEEMREDDMREFAQIISWNLWQMDGLKFVVPMSCTRIPKHKSQKQLFKMTVKEVATLECPGCEDSNFVRGITKTTDDKLKGSHDGHTGIYCIVKNWDAETEGKVIYFGQCLETSTERENLKDKIKESNKIKKQDVKVKKLF